ncbi:hypothetical protein H4582DRAFT_2065755 [Lactarius indigo]|nr:hypothetical protein H4582DRAFT_2065755 [Lactarius indigo]
MAGSEQRCVRPGIPWMGRNPHPPPSPQARQRATWRAGGNAVRAQDAGRAARGAGQGHADTLVKLSGPRKARRSSSIGRSPGWGQLGTMQPASCRASDAAVPSPRARRSSHEVVRAEEGPTLVVDREIARLGPAGNHAASFETLGQRQRRHDTCVVPIPALAYGIVDEDIDEDDSLGTSGSVSVSDGGLYDRVCSDSGVWRAPFLRVYPNQFHLGILPQEPLTPTLAVAVDVDNNECVGRGTSAGKICEVKKCGVLVNVIVLASVWVLKPPWKTVLEGKEREKLEEHSVTGMVLPIQTDIHTVPVGGGDNPADAETEVDTVGVREQWR